MELQKANDMYLYIYAVMKIGLENKYSHFFRTLRSNSIHIFLVLQNCMHLVRLNGFEIKKTWNKRL